MQVAKRRSSNHGFTLLEVLVSVVVLTIGLVAIAALISKVSGNTSRSRFMSIAAMLASEKLEDLNRFPADDPNVYAANSGTAGSLTANTGPVSVTSDGVTENVDYYDEVQLSGSSGFVTETVTGTDAMGNKTSTELQHKPDGTITSNTYTTAPTVGGADAVTFIRRWLIEKDPAGLPAGVRRVTVVVTLQGLTGVNGVSFQTSMVRP